MIQTCQRIIRKASFTDRLLLILMVFTCTFFIYRDFGIRMILGYAALGLILGIHLLRRIDGHKKLSLTCMEGVFLVLVLVIWISYLRPDARRDADTFSYVIAMTICTFFVLLSQSDTEELRKSLRVVRFAAFLLSVYVIFFVLFKDLFWTTIYPLLSDTAAEYLDYYVPKGYSITVGGVTYTDYILFLGAASSAGLFLSQKPDRKIRYRYLVEMAYFAIVILLTGRRGEFLGVILTCLVLFIATGDLKRLFSRLILTGTRKQNIIRCAILFGGILACIGLLILALPLLKRVDVLYRYVITLEKLLHGEDISSGRLELYQWAWAAFLQKPLFGIGWARFVDCITPEFHQIHGLAVTDVHCIYLQFLCETGLVGAVLMIFPLVYVYAQTARQFVRLRKTGCDMENGNVLVMVNGTSFVLQTFLLIMGIYDPCFQRVVFWCFYGLAVILASAALKLEGYAFDDKVSLCLRKIFGKLSLYLRKIWEKVSPYLQKFGEKAALWAKNMAKKIGAALRKGIKTLAAKIQARFGKK